MQTSKKLGMQLLDDALSELVVTKQITYEDALEFANDPANIKTKR